MPVIRVDLEGAELIDAAVEMFEAALRARSKRADPDRIISDSLVLQGNKLRSARQQLRQGEPPGWHMLPDELRLAALQQMKIMVSDPSPEASRAVWEALRDLMHATDFPTPGAQGLARLPPLESEH